MLRMCVPKSWMCWNVTLNLKKLKYAYFKIAGVVSEFKKVWNLYYKHMVYNDTPIVSILGKPLCMT